MPAQHGNAEAAGHVARGGAGKQQSIGGAVCRNDQLSAHCNPQAPSRVDDGGGSTRPVLVSTFRDSGTTVVRRNFVVEFRAVPVNTFTEVGALAVGWDVDIRLDCQRSNAAQYQSRADIQLDAPPDGKCVAVDCCSGRGSWHGDRAGAAQRYCRKISAVCREHRSRCQHHELGVACTPFQTRAGREMSGKANGKAAFTIQYNQGGPEQVALTAVAVTSKSAWCRALPWWLASAALQRRWRRLIASF